MRCNHKNLLRINFIAQSRDQLEVKQELRLVAKEKKQAPPSSDLQSKSKTEALFFLLVRRKGFEPLTFGSVDQRSLKQVFGALLACAEKTRLQQKKRSAFFVFS